MKTTVIHHSADFDGLFCREIARKFLPGAELIGWDFGDAPVRPTAGDGAVYILDLPCDKPLGLKPDEIWPGCSNLIWIDHHKSSIESHPKDIPGYRIDGVAACRLAWQWFTGWNRYKTEQGGNAKLVSGLAPMSDAEWFSLHWPFPKKEDFIDRKVVEPLAVRLAGEYDIWDKRDERVDAFQFGLRSVDAGADFWEALLQTDAVGEKSVADLMENGWMLQRYQQRNDASMMGRSFIVEFEGLKFLALTTARCNSLTFASRDKPETGHDALMGFYYDGKGWTVSMYHAEHRKDIDLSQIAVKYGGGGHRGACGFKTNRGLPFLP